MRCGDGLGVAGTGAVLPGKVGQGAVLPGKVVHGEDGQRKERPMRWNVIASAFFYSA